MSFFWKNLFKDLLCNNLGFFLAVTDKSDIFLIGEGDGCGVQRDFQKKTERKQMSFVSSIAHTSLELSRRKPVARSESRGLTLVQATV